MYMFGRNRRAHRALCRGGGTRRRKVRTPSQRADGADDLHVVDAAVRRHRDAVLDQSTSIISTSWSRADEALVASAEFMSWINANDELYTGEVSDVVLEVISGAPTAPPAPYVLIVRGVAANGALADAAATGVELAETATRLTGNLTSFLMPVVGEFGAVGWTTQLPDLAALEAARRRCGRATNGSSWRIDLDTPTNQVSPPRSCVASADHAMNR